MRVPSISFYGAITPDDTVPGGGESGHIAVKPTEPYTVFGGSVGNGLDYGRFRAWYPDTDQTRNITVTARSSTASPRRRRSTSTDSSGPSRSRSRPHNPDKLYATSNYVHVSYDEGRQLGGHQPGPDPQRPGPPEYAPAARSPPRTSAPKPTARSSRSRSRPEEGVICSGSDDGLMYVTKDGGKNWDDITRRTICCQTVRAAGPHQHDRRLSPQGRNGLCRRQPLPARRPVAVPS
ncbi:MAG: hypothetical protein R2849_14920 [Thermomicrobiales bacterium]